MSEAHYSDILKAITITLEKEDYSLTEWIIAAIAKAADVALEAEDWRQLRSCACLLDGIKQAEDKAGEVDHNGEE